MDLHTAINNCGLSRHANQIIASARPCVRIHSRLVEQSDLSPTASSFGGLPHLPIGAPWPHRAGQPLCFQGMIRLSQCAAHDATKTLPPTGLLYFWYDDINGPSGMYPIDHDGFRVDFVESEGTPLALAKLPAALEGHPPFAPRLLSFEPGISIGDDSSIPLIDNDRNELSEIVKYWDLLLAIGQSAKPAHRLLGHPTVIHNPMEEECQLVSNGVLQFRSVGESVVGPLRPGIADWRLLIQIDTEENSDGPNWMLPNYGTLYFWIRHQDLAARDFSKCWLIFQTD